MSIFYIILTSIPVIAYLAYTRLYHWRHHKYRHLPQLPNSLLLGHLRLFGEYIKKYGKPRQHSDYAFQRMWKDAGHPEIMLVDVRPVSLPITLVTSHAVAEQIVKPSKTFPLGAPKSPTFGEFKPMLGHESILTKEGEAWKTLRKKFNPGFAPQHLSTLLPAIINKATVFMSRLDALAESGAEFALEPLTTNVTFDIIGKVVLNTDFEAQNPDTGGHPIVYHYRKVIHSFRKTGTPGLIPWWIDLSMVTERFYNARKADAAIKQLIKDKFAAMQPQNPVQQPSARKKPQDRSVLALALKDIDHLEKDTLQSIADQVKTFLFAGHDTTSILLQWLYYALSIHPSVLSKLRAEHAAVFGAKDPRDVYLAQPDATAAALVYTSACIKEALRLWPPAGTARVAPEGSAYSLRLEDGREFCVDGTLLYVVHFLIQRDPKVYGETADDFVPERWLGDSDTSSTREHDTENKTENDTTARDPKAAAETTKLPIPAWRPFERGPRHCIGQELANLEARVILACTIQRYDFTKIGPGAVDVDARGERSVDEKGRYKLRSELYNTAVVTSKPLDSMMKVRFCDARV